MRDEKTGRFKKGIIPWNKGKKGVQICWSKGLTKETDNRLKEASRKTTGVKRPKGKDFVSKKIIIVCNYCKKEFKSHPSLHHKFCSRKCFYSFSSKYLIGEKKNVWKGGIENHKKEDRRNDPAYQKWVKLVKIRDKYDCRLKDKNCSRKKIVHHILSWRKFLDCRYKINNGITLCQFHHPRAWDEEKRLISKFQELVSVSN